MSAAHEHAQVLAASVAVAGGPLLRVEGARAYFPGGDFVSVGPHGSVSSTTRGKQTFTEASLPARWKSGWRKGLQVYLGTLNASARAENPVSEATVQAAINQATRLAGRSKPGVVSAAEYALAVEIAEQELNETAEDALYGCGDFGCAAQLEGRDGILKVTTDREEERVVAAVVRTQAFQGFAEIWKGPVHLTPHPGMVWPWFAYTREVVLVTERQMPRGSWNILRALDEARLEGHEAEYLRGLVRLWAFARRYPSMMGIAQTARALWRDGYMLGDFHSGNYGERGPTFVLFDAKATMRTRPDPPRKRNPARPRAKLPEGVDNWYSEFGPQGVPRRGERGHSDPIPFDLKQAIHNAFRLWRDPEAGPMIRELMASEGYDDEYGGDPVDSDERMFSFDELPDLAGIDASPDDVAHIFKTIETTLEDIPEDEAAALPSWLEVGIVSDALDPAARDRPRLVNVRKQDAIEFVKRHHSALPDVKHKPGLMYAIGVAVGREIVAVATAGTPSGPFRSRGCRFDGILELSRVASNRDFISPLTGEPLKGASSMLASRILDLLPRSGRRGIDGCLFVTYSFLSEKGTTYLALVDKGLRPVGLTPGSDPHGARKGAGSKAKPKDPKIIWEGGPAARPPDWSVLEKSQAPLNQIEGAMDRFYAWDKRERKAGRGIRIKLAHKAKKKP